MLQIVTPSPFGTNEKHTDQTETAVFLAPLSLTVFPVYTLPGARHTPLC